MVGVALGSWATVTFSYSGDNDEILTVNYTYSGDDNELQNFQSSVINENIPDDKRGKIETLILTGDFTNDDFGVNGKLIDPVIARCVKEGPGNINAIKVDISGCTKIYSKIVPTDGSTGNNIDWTSSNFLIENSDADPQPVDVSKQTFYYGKKGQALETWVTLNNLKVVEDEGITHYYALDYMFPDPKPGPAEATQIDGQNYFEVFPKKEWVYTVNGSTNKYYGPVTNIVTDDNGEEISGKGLVSPGAPFGFGNSKIYISGIVFPSGNENFTAIPDGLFKDNAKLLTVEFSKAADEDDEILWIGREAFQKCTKLTTCELPASIKVIQASAFNGADKLSMSLDLTDTDVRMIGAMAFKETKLANFTGNDKLVTIGYEAFDGIKTLKYAYLQNCTNLQKIDYEAFEFCSALDSIGFPSGRTLKFIGNDAFKQTAVVNIDMSMCEGITEFQSKGNDGTVFKTFNNCTALKFVSLPPNLTAVPADAGDGVFFGCSALKEVQFNGIAVYDDCDITNKCTIGDGAFQDMNNLATVTLSNNISSIGVKAFAYAAIREIHIPASVEELKTHSFIGCQNLTTVYFDACAEPGCDGEATIVAGKEGVGGQGFGAFQTCQHITDVYINTTADLQCNNNAFDQLISWGAGNTEGNFATLHYPKSKIKHYVNLAHYLTDETVTNPGLFHNWLMEHYKQAIVPHKNGWYEFINSGPFDPNDETEYQDIMLRTFSDWNYSYLVPNGLRAYVVNHIDPVGDDNYEVTLQRINVIPKKTGVILYGHPNGKNQQGKPTLVLTPVKFLEYGDPLYDQKYNEAGELVSCEIEYNEDGTMKKQDTYVGPDQGAALCRANWGKLDEAHAMYKNYLEPIISANGDPVTIKPYETVKVNGVNKIKFRNFGLGRFTSTDYYKKNTNTQADLKSNYVGFFRMKANDYPSGYAYLHLSGDVDENGNVLENSEFPAADGGEIFVQPDTKYDVAKKIYPYNYEFKVSDGLPFDASASFDTAGNPVAPNYKGWWNPNASPTKFVWDEPEKSWGNRTKAFNSTASNGAFKYFGELEEDVDGVVKLVIPANNNANGEYYTLQGMKVTVPTKGVYIRNGKKVVIK